MDHIPLVIILARIYQVAVLLYGILTLPSATSAAWAVATTTPQPGPLKLRPYDGLRVSKRQELLKLLRQTALCWPLVVAGVALADGDAADKKFVDDSLLTIWMTPNTWAAPFVCRTKLLVFWRSGSMAWEDCFDEPVPCIG
ncbi:hypothetical protein LLEC1_07600 [Akanthomyces lecanii]|uniref:Uncharacterized protein n=1 Tax=Cordyceps confragosa TaxID=2714763 RepID=A0A179I4R4_CORDF|nr:hypothetical protein LLEC1_07600 [Akanthomyces lecanii]